MKKIKQTSSRRNILLITSTLLFLAATIAFAMNYDKVYSEGADEQKGDYIFFCIKISVLLTFIYFILVRISLREVFPIYLVFLIPIFLCIISIFVAFVITALGIMKNSEDQYLIRLYLMIQGILASLFAWPFARHIPSWHTKE